MRDGLRARLLRVVDEVALRVQALLGAEDLDRVLVRADGPVRAEAEEDRAHRLGRLDVELCVVGQARAGDVVVDPDREPASRPLGGELGEDAGDHARRELLRREAVAAADDPRHHLALAVRERLGERRDGVEEQRLADRARLLRPVEHGDAAHARRQRLDERLRRERPVQPHLQRRRPARRARSAQATVSRIGLAARAHHDEHALGLGMAGVVDDVVRGGRCARRGAPSRPRRRRARARRTG